MSAAEAAEVDVTEVDVTAVEAAALGAVGPSRSDAAASPFTMMVGDPSAMVCEGDVCFIPGASPVE
ncbi:hypothetical protein [Agromyces sp. Leaf222]|uniref:hypothetical protein n=1 Tax=Agromyces sp. Leaf222 TaxID=1735688 RepID=UPI0006F5F1DC|nr:hypothetical protein [Agromyces sp. Leaf222]KQM83679.1 hypothetical protein ASE68_11045 [Agromyces sp. Leaf222]